MSKHQTIKKICTSVLTLAVILGLGVAHGHHSFNANFDRGDKREFTGVVVEFWFANPHVRVYLDVTNEDGETEEWMVEGNSRNNLIRAGWSEDTVTPGMIVTVAGFASRDGSKTLGWIPGTPLLGEDGEPIEPEE